MRWVLVVCFLQSLGKVVKRSMVWLVGAASRANKMDGCEAMGALFSGGRPHRQAFPCFQFSFPALPNS